VRCKVAQSLDTYLFELEVELQDALVASALFSLVQPYPCCDEFAPVQNDSTPRELSLPCQSCS
jgi:hypothetical protein